MSFLPSGKANYQTRLERAELLVERYFFAREVLEFYGHIVRFQKEFSEQLSKSRGKGRAVSTGGKFEAELDASALAAPFGEFLAMIEARGPGPLAGQARQVRTAGEADRAEILTEFWKAGLQETDSGEPLREVLARAFLQPYAEFLAAAQLPPVLAMTVCRCPRCNSLPLLGVLRPEGDGAKRFLLCALCSQEWEFRRILCAHCGEEEEGKLPVYVAEQFPHIRMECCESCKHFLRTIDLTKDGNAVPIVDDLAAIPLSLWAQENGYRRIQSNLLRT
jgi:FdhE protein